MLSLDAFVRLCAGHIEKGEPFIAYRHPHGFGLLRTGAVKYEEWKVIIEERDHYGVYHARFYHAQTPELRDHYIREARKFSRPVLGVETVYKEKKVKKGTVTKAHKVIAQMRKDRRCYPLHVVEFDGIGLTLEGGGLDELLTVPVPTGRD